MVTAGTSHCCSCSHPSATAEVAAHHVPQVAKRARVLCHVDACLGGFVLPFARQLGYPIPPFDFAVPGVTSMSVDTHKFGMAHKGTSVVLYHSKDLRRYQYTSITEWSGGLYISPGEKPGCGVCHCAEGAVICPANARLGQKLVTSEGWADDRGSH